MGNSEAKKKVVLHDIGLTEDRYDFEMGTVTSMEDALTLIESDAVAIRFPWQMNLRDEEVHILAPKIRDSPLKAVQIFDNNITDAGAKELAELMQDNDSIVYFKFGAANIRIDGSNAFLNKIATNHTLLELNFSRVPMGDEGTKAVAHLLVTNSTLRVLSLVRNDIGAAGAVNIASGLEQNASLIRLDLSDNDIGNKGCLHLAKTLKVNDTLLALIVGGVSSDNIDNTGARAFADALNENDSLVTLGVKAKVSLGIEDQIRSKLSRNTEKHIRSRDAFKDVLEKGHTKVPWNRVKLMVVGQGRSGKTATVNALLGVSVRGVMARKNTITRTLERAARRTVSPSTVGLDMKRIVTGVDGASWEHSGAVEGGDHAVSSAAQLVVNRFAKMRKSQQLHNRFSRSISKLSLPEFTQTSTTESPQRHSLRKSQKLKRSNSRSNSRAGSRAGSHTKTRKRSLAVKTRDWTRARLERHQEKRSRVPMMPADEIERRFHTKLIAQAEESVQHEVVQFTVWDFGGQEVFYALHHLFLTQQGIYLVVFSLKDLRDDEAATLKYVKYWLESIRIHGKDAPVFVVGTFLDKIAHKLWRLTSGLSRDASPVDRFEQVLSNLIKPFKGVVRNKPDKLSFFPVANTNVKTLLNLRKAIEQTAREQEYVNKSVYLRWLRTLDLMTKRPERPWMSLEEVKRIGRQCGLTNTQETLEMLTHFHERGAVLYFSETEALQEIVTIDPQWLVSCLSLVIRDRELHLSKLDVDEIERIGMLDDLNMLFDRALASRDLLEYLWKREKVDFLLDLMQQTMLLSLWMFEEDKMFLIPSLIKETKPIQVPTTLDFYIDFSSSYIPIGVFERLCCLCVGWSGDPKRTGSKQPLIYRSSAQVWFGAEGFIVLELFEQESKISVRFAAEQRAPEFMSLVLGFVRQINMEIFHMGLSWQTMLKGQDEEYVPFADAKANGLMPWFSKTKPVTTFDLDKFDEAMGTPSERDLRKKSRRKASKSSFKESSRSLNPNSQEEEKELSS